MPIFKKTKCRMKWCYNPTRTEDGDCDKYCFYNTKTVLSNGDIIRNMNDEEIALLLFSQRIDAYESHIGTKEEILNWLKKDTHMRKREE